jgi:phosphoglycolate phosphatase
MSGPLVLWDIDHTLVSLVGWSRRMYEVAFLAATGRALVDLVDMAGRTETAILGELLARHGLTAEAALVERCFTALSSAAHDLRDEVAGCGRSLPGAVDALALLAAAGATQTVVTGNLPAVAEIKLAPFGLTTHLDFSIGGYGSDAAERVFLVHLARERAAARYRCAFPADRTFVIGDTPHDVLGAKLAGAVAIGVATGRSDAAVLAAAGADLVLSDLSDPTPLCAAILDRPHR